MTVRQIDHKQLNSRLRQTGTLSPAISKKATIVVDSTESEDSDSDSELDYDPTTDMSHISDEVVEAELQKSKTERHAIMDARRAKIRKLGSGGKGKGVVSSSNTVSPCITGDETTMMPPPRVVASRSKAVKTPSFYDVDRCTRWEAPLGDEETRVELQNLPVLPRPHKSQGFGVIGAAPQYAYDVLAPYKSFDGDESKLKDESTVEGFGAMLEDSAALMARLSFHSRFVAESKMNMERRYHESQAEVDRMRVALDESVAQRGRLVEDAVEAYNRGVKEGGMEGWSEAVKAYREAGFLDQAVVDSVICHLALSDGKEDLMAGDGAGGSGAAVAPGDEMLP